jgi:hypothetical protein
VDEFQPKGPRLWLWMIAPFVVILAYPLSEGPMLYALSRGWISYEACAATYEPLWQATEETPVGSLLEHYGNWWVSRATR